MMSGEDDKWSIYQFELAIYSVELISIVVALQNTRKALQISEFMNTDLSSDQ